MYEREYGSKYDRDLDVAEIAKRIRKDLRAAVKAGELPAAKVSVTIDRYSMGQSIRAEIKDVPGEWYSPEFLAWREESDHNDIMPRDVERWSNDVRKVGAWLERELWSYNHDGSDVMTDYFDVNFYASVVAPDGCTMGNGIKTDEEKAFEEAEAEERYERVRAEAEADIEAETIAAAEADTEERDEADELMARWENLGS